MRRAALVKGFVAGLPRYYRPQHETFEWLAAAHARALATESHREDALEKLQGRMAQLVQRYSCADEHIGWRRSDLHDFMHTDWSRMRIFNLHESPQGRGLEVRNAVYAETVDRAVQELFSQEKDPPSDLLHVSCTGYTSPSAIQRLIVVKKWNSCTQATQVYHMGCYAALPALRIAAGLVTCADGKRVSPRADVVHTEVCTLHFNPADHSPEQFIVQTLFADGYIRYSVVPEYSETRGADGAFELIALREVIVPESLGDMTWTLSEWGFRMTLARDVPGKIANSLPRFLSDLFAEAGMEFRKERRDAVFAVHPGGPRILDSVEALLQLEKEQVRLSRSILFERGNMSSATLPHIWMAIAADKRIKAGTLVTSLAFGPGLTIAGALFRKC